MPKDISEYYRALDLNPGASLDEIKRAYRQLLQRWHPDHFKPGSVMQTTAEDITKDINEAYNQLCRKKRYLEYRNKAQPRKAPVEKRAAPEPWSAPVHQARKTYEQGPGKPRETPRPEPASAPEPTRSAPPRAAAASSSIPPNPSRTPRRPVDPPAPPKSSAPPLPRERVVGRTSRWPRRTIVIVAGVAIAMAGVWQWRLLHSSWLPSSTPASAFVTSPKSAAAPRANRALASEAKNKIRGISFQKPALTSLTGFTPMENPLLAAGFPGWSMIPGSMLKTPVLAVGTLDANRILDEAVALLDTFERGDSKAKVRAVQGPPDDAGENIFRYGSSLVYFSEGRVTTWLDGRPRLRVFVLPSFEFEGLATFRVGSTKSEVVRIQGLPTNTTRGAFYYGASVVYFDREWVTSWVEVDQRLRAYLLPTAGSVNLDQFVGR